MLPSHKTHIACSYFLSLSKSCPSLLKIFVFSDEEVNYWVTTAVELLCLASKVEKKDLLIFNVIDVTPCSDLCFQD
jgi:hypothetical protein